MLDRAAMRQGETHAGPALIEEAESTTVLLPGDTAEISSRGNLILNLGGAK